MLNEENETFSTAETAEIVSKLLGRPFTARTMRNWVARGVFVHVRTGGGQIRIFKDSVEQFRRCHQDWRREKE